MPAEQTRPSAQGSSLPHSRQPSSSCSSQICQVAAAAHLRLRRHVRSLYSVGFCFGGRISFLLATEPALSMAGVIGFYGWPVGPFLNDTPAPAALAGKLEAPVLGIFGGADEKIPATDVEAFRQALAAASVEGA